MIGLISNQIYSTYIDWSFSCSFFLLYRFVTSILVSLSQSLSTLHLQINYESQNAKFCTLFFSFFSPFLLEKRKDNKQDKECLIINLQRNGTILNIKVIKNKKKFNKIFTLGTSAGFGYIWKRKKNKGGGFFPIETNDSFDKVRIKH